MMCVNARNTFACAQTDLHTMIGILIRRYLVIASMLSSLAYRQFSCFFLYQFFLHLFSFAVIAGAVTFAAAAAVVAVLYMSTHVFVNGGGERR